MKSILMPFVALLSLSAIAEEQRVYRVDRYGNVKCSEPSYSVVKDDRIVEVDAYGSRQPQKPTDAYGRLRRQKFESRTSRDLPK